MLLNHKLHINSQSTPNTWERVHLYNVSINAVKVKNDPTHQFNSYYLRKNDCNSATNQLNLTFCAWMWTWDIYSSKHTLNIDSYCGSTTNIGELSEYYLSIICFTENILDTIVFLVFVVFFFWNGTIVVISLLIQITTTLQQKQKMPLFNIAATNFSRQTKYDSNCIQIEYAKKNHPFYDSTQKCNL